MHEDFLVTPSKLKVSGKTRSLSTKESKFVQNDKSFRAWIDGKQAEVDFTLTPVKGYAPIHKDYHLGNFFGYNILKINRLNLKGKINAEGKVEKIQGTAYLQKVFVSGPVIPWQWSIVHFENGSYLSYNIGRIGHSLFAEHHHPLDITLRKKLEFYDAKTGKLHYFKKVKIKRSRGELPTFNLQASSGEAKLSIDLKSYSRALWRLQKSRLHSLNTLYYHEFCVFAKHFSLITKGGELTLRDVGKGVGNCEDSKGFMV
jgi:hypothetical protein